MDYYLDIKIVPDEEVPIYWSQVASQNYAL